MPVTSFVIAFNHTRSTTGRIPNVTNTRCMRNSFKFQFTRQYHLQVPRTYTVPCVDTSKSLR